MKANCIGHFLVLCIVLSLLATFLLVFVHPECGEERAGKFILNVSYSLLAGGVVYAFTVYFPKKSTEDVLRGVIKDRIEGFGNQILNMTFEFRQDITILETTQVEELVRSIDKIEAWDRQSITCVFGDVKLGIAFIKAYMELKKDIGEFILTYHELLDSDQMLLLEKLRNSKIASYEFLLNNKMGNANLFHDIFVPAYRELLEDYNKLNKTFEVE